MGRAPFALPWLVIAATCLLSPTQTAAAEDPPASSAKASKKGRDAELEVARRLFEQGHAAYVKGELPAARDAFERAFAVAPSPALAFDLARACERLGDRGCAIENLRYYLRHGKPERAERERLQARVAELEAELAEREREHAKPTANELTAEGRAFFERGLALYERGRYRAAYEAFVAARRFAPVPEVLYNIARSAEQLGRAREASDLYRAYLDARPKAKDRARIEARIAELRASR